MIVWLLLLALVRGDFFQPLFEPFPEVAPRDDVQQLYDYVPVSSTITQSETQRFVYGVNTTNGVGSAYELLIFLTGNICQQPDDTAAAANESLTVYYSFNELIYELLETSQMVQFTDGYFQGLADVPITEPNLTQYENLYLVVGAPQSTNTSAVWEYQIGVSQLDLVFQWDAKAFALVVDTDDRSALIVTGNLTGPSNENLTSLDESGYNLYVYTLDYKDYFRTLNNSWCAVRNGPALLTAPNFTTSYTLRGGLLRQQFYVSGLNASTSYIAYLLLDVNLSSLGGIVYSVFEFETMSSAACRLIYDLDFCDEVAYSVPALSFSDISNAADLKLLYDNHAESLYTNFSKAIQQVACNTTKDALFLPIRSCDDCITLYKNWLCAVTVPRCSSHDYAGYVERKPGASRNTFLDEYVAPNLTYYEVMPCVNVCNAIVRDCPAALGFNCPTGNSSIKKSYYWDLGANYTLCNYLGVTLSTSAASAVRLALGILLPLVAAAIMMV